ncbi:hypothetical protein BS47DRAFT_335910 [Hydnum rufescens UP504]|uniref:Uncharacterized protein n=1 Tax=Hydnum rufescens UP504 TaxID=1448309 RepID=A0A9P6E1D3_9AGAM|nr:hypothetical protein BS47DRAFT_335910 [Hydnum rufescens UP504]
MKYIPKSASIISISSDSESDRASVHVLQPKNDSPPTQEISDDPPFTNDEYLTLIKFLASIRVHNEDTQWQKFHRMHPQRSRESWTNCVRRNREFFNEQVSLLEAREPFRRSVMQCPNIFPPPNLNGEEMFGRNSRRSTLIGLWPRIFDMIMHIPPWSLKLVQVVQQPKERVQTKLPRLPRWSRRPATLSQVRTSLRRKSKP